MIRIIREIRSL